MRIGIDLDNTIIDYSEAFQYGARKFKYVPNDWEGDKLTIRKTLNSMPEGEKYWRKLQGQVYGNYIHKAKLYKGVKEFLLSVKNYYIVVVSNKTRYGYNDSKKIELREVAMKFLCSNGIWNKKKKYMIDELFFIQTRKGKIKKITELDLDYFIDDLPEILNDKDFPKKVTKILFDPSNHHEFHTDIRCSRWSDINHLILEGKNNSLNKYN